MQIYGKKMKRWVPKCMFKLKAGLDLERLETTAPKEGSLREGVWQEMHLDPRLLPLGMGPAFF